MKDSNVIAGHFNTILPLSSERVCDGAKEADLLACIIVGVRRNGDLYFASTDGDKAFVLWTLERAKKALMNDL